MIKVLTTQDEIRLRHLEDVYTSVRLAGITFSKTEAMKIVGSRTVLEKLAFTGKIRYKKHPTAQMGKWECNGEDVIRYANYKKKYS